MASFFAAMALVGLASAYPSVSSRSGMSALENIGGVAAQWSASPFMAGAHYGGMMPHMGGAHVNYMAPYMNPGAYMGTASRIHPLLHYPVHPAVAAHHQKEAFSFHRYGIGELVAPFYGAVDKRTGSSSPVLPGLHPAVHQAVPFLYSRLAHNKALE
jgi:hypothetical protein